MTEDPYGEAWVYESLVGAIPGLSLPDRLAVVLQFVVFETAVLGLAFVYALPRAVLPATVAVGVAAVGSWFMLDIASRARRLDLPPTYRRLLFASNVEVLLGVVAYAALVTYLVAVDAATPSLVASLLGESPPALAVFLLLLVAWDVCYRIGTGWWTAVVTLYATVRYPSSAPTGVRSVAGRTIAFALVQVALVPFLLDHPLLAVAVAGHVVAVWVVLALAVLADRN
jgi:hypothetical protein